jgi:hypothetical protein
MSRPKDIEEKYERMIEAWRTLAPDKSFGGMTLAQFEATCEPSRTRRRNIARLENEIADEKAERDLADRALSGKMQLVVAGVQADPTEGPDSALVEGFGLIRKSARKTGLTRKRKATATK